MSAAASRNRPRGLGEIGRVRLAVGNAGEMMRGIAADHGEEALGLFALRRRQRLRPGFELLARHVLGVEIGAQRLALRHAGQKRGVAVQIGPGAFVEPEIMGARFAQRVCGAGQRRVPGAAAAPKLVHEREVQDARGLHEFGEGLAVPGGQRRFIVFQLHGRETRAHLLQVGEIGHNGSDGQECSCGEQRKRLHRFYSSGL